LGKLLIGPVACLGGSGRINRNSYRKGCRMALSRHNRGLLGVVIFMAGVGVLGQFTPEEWRRGPEPPKAPAPRERYVAGPGLLRPGYVMCVSESALSESYTLRKSGRLDMLHDIGCVRTSGEHDAVLTDWGFAVSEVRVRPNGGGASRAFYVASEALVRQDQ
jgi:hypothetical protein